MKSTSVAAYREVFRYLKREVPDLSVPAYMGDFDDGAREAIGFEFPEAQIFGCSFYFAKCLVRHVSNPAVGLASDIRKRGELLDTFLSFTALPHLPPGEMASVFSKLSEEAICLDQRFCSLYDYINNWMQTIGPTGLSVFRAPCRSTYSIESNSAMILRDVGKVRGPVWDLIGESLQGFL